MRIKNPTEQEQKLLATIGMKLVDMKKLDLDWYMYYPVIDEDRKVVGIIPADGIAYVDYDIDEDEQVVRESKIQDFRTGFLSGRPYYHL